MMERRQSRRYPATEAVEIRLVSTPHAVVAGCIRDISDDGLGVTLNGYLPKGSHLEVECEHWAMRGTVVHGTKSPDQDATARYSYGIRMNYVDWNAAPCVDLKKLIIPMRIAVGNWP